LIRQMKAFDAGLEHTSRRICAAEISTRHQTRVHRRAQAAGSDRSAGQYTAGRPAGLGRVPCTSRHAGGYGPTEKCIMSHGLPLSRGHVRSADAAWKLTRLDFGKDW
jgi:hypothetical protein